MMPYRSRRMYLNWEVFIALEKHMCSEFGQSLSYSSD